MYSIVHSCQDLIKYKISRHIVEDYTNAKFHKNLSSGSRVVSMRTQTDRQTDMTDMTKLRVAFRNFTKAPINGYLALCEIFTRNTIYLHLGELYND